MHAPCGVRPLRGLKGNGMKTLKQLCAAHTKALNSNADCENDLHHELLAFQPKNKSERLVKLAYFAALLLRNGSVPEPKEIELITRKAT